MMNFRVIKDKAECKKVWNKLSPKKSLWDLWEFRIVFHPSESFFHFIVGYADEKPAALLPLVFDESSDHYMYFGDLFPEQNKIFMKDKKEMELLLSQCPYHTVIYYIDSSEAEHYPFKKAEKRYFLDLKKYRWNVDNYLMTFNKKHRKNLRYDIRKLQKEGYTFKVNDIKDYKELIRFNKEAFEEDSDFNDNEFVESIRQCIRISLKKNMLDMISIVKDDKVQAVGVGIVYNRSYCVIAMGRNVDLKNLGKFLIFEQIKSAISKKCDTIDFLSTESGWKDLWNLDSEHMYEWEK